MFEISVLSVFLWSAKAEVLGHTSTVFDVIDWLLIIATYWLGMRMWAFSTCFCIVVWREKY